MPIPVAAEPPLIVTAHLDDASFAILDELRLQHFPSALNQVPAHLSLFHHLPGAELRCVLTHVHEICAETQPIDLRPLPPRFLGRGVALAYAAEDLTALHRRLATVWVDWLTAQDRQPFKAHITIQNKVTPAEARALWTEMQAIAPPPCRVEGIDVWRYIGGPWKAVATVAFRSGTRLTETML